MKKSAKGKDGRKAALANRAYAFTQGPLDAIRKTDLFYLPWEV
jgi:hypothetical protein